MTPPLVADRPFHTVEVRLFDEERARFDTVAAFAGETEDDARAAALAFCSEAGHALTHVRLVPYNLILPEDVEAWRAKWSPEPTDTARLLVIVDTQGWTVSQVAQVKAALSEVAPAASVREVTAAELELGDPVRPCGVAAR